MEKSGLVLIAGIVCIDGTVVIFGMKFHSTVLGVPRHVLVARPPARHMLTFARTKYQLLARAVYIVILVITATPHRIHRLVELIWELP